MRDTFYSTFFEKNQGRTGDGDAISMNNSQMTTRPPALVGFDEIVINGSIFI